MDSSQHIYTPEDGSRVIAVLVNGEKVDGCYFADTKRGIAKCFRMPIKLDKYHKRALDKTYRGKVEVICLPLSS